MRKYSNILLGRKNPYPRSDLFSFPKDSYPLYIFLENGERGIIGEANNVSFDGKKITGTIETDYKGDYYVHTGLVTVPGLDGLAVHFFALREKKVSNLYMSSELVSLKGRRMEI